MVRLSPFPSALHVDTLLLTLQPELLSLEVAIRHSWD